VTERMELARIALAGKTCKKSVAALKEIEEWEAKLAMRDEFIRVMNRIADDRIRKESNGSALRQHNNGSRAGSVSRH